MPIAPPCAMADLKETVAINVRRLRHERGWTQEDLADRVGLSARYVGQIERAQASMTTPCSGGSRMRLRSRPRNWSHVLGAGRAAANRNQRAAKSRGGSPFRR